MYQQYRKKEADKNQETTGMLPLYKSLVRPRLEYAVQFWSPHLQRDIIKIKKVQRKSSKMIPEIRNHSYSQRLKDLNLISLEQRRLRGQLIKVFKYLWGFNNKTALFTVPSISFITALNKASKWALRP